MNLFASDLYLRAQFAISLDAFFKFLADVAGRLFRHAARFKKEGQQCQTD